MFFNKALSFLKFGCESWVYEKQLRMLQKMAVLKERNVLKETLKETF